MNKHYSDAWYYLKRAGEELATALSMSTSSVEMKTREKLGMESAAHPDSQTDRLKEELEEVRARTEAESERLYSHALEQIEEIQRQIKQQNRSKSKGILK